MLPLSIRDARISTPSIEARTLRTLVSRNCRPCPEMLDAVRIVAMNSLKRLFLQHLIRSLHYLRLASWPRNSTAKITTCGRSLHYQTDHVIPRSIRRKRHPTIVSRTRGQSLLHISQDLGQSDPLRLSCRILRFSLRLCASTS
jgi:hypothetical protein